MSMRWQTQELYFRQLLAQRLGIPVLGKIFFAFLAGSTTNAWEEWIETEMDIPAELKFQGVGAIEEAYDHATANRNDVVLAMPGLYTRTASMAWNKNSTHLVGCGGPLSRGNMSETSGEVTMNITTTDVASVIDVQADHVQFHGVHLRNAGAHAENLCGLKLTSGRSFYAQDCHFSGQAAATQIAQPDTCALWFYSTGSDRPWGARFRDCKIGDAGELVRTDGPVIYFSGTTGSTLKYVEFIDCVIEGWTETAAVPAVFFSANYCIDRYVLWKRCLFYNYYVNNVSDVNEVFENACGTTFNCIIQGSLSVGYSAWNATGLNYFVGNQALPAATGGTGVALT